MCQAAKEAVWLNGLLEDLGVEFRSPLIINGDNQGAPALARNPDTHPRSKHIDIQYRYTRELIHPGRIAVEYIPTKFMLAGALTKPLPRFEMLIEEMGVYRDESAVALRARRTVGDLVPPSQHHSTVPRSL